MHILNRSFWATIALTALVDAAPSKLEARQEDRICRAVKEALGPQATPLCQSYIDAPGTSTITVTATETAVQSNVRTTQPPPVTVRTALNVSSTVFVVNRYTTYLANANVTQTQTVTLPQTTVYTYNAVRKRAFQTGFGTGAPYLNSTASATAKATPAGLPADLDDVDPDALGAELEAEVESDPDIAAFEDRYGEDLVSSACSCVFTPTFRTVTETARVTRLAASVITRPALTNFVGTTVTVTVTRPVDVTTTLGASSTATAQVTTTVVPTPVTRPAVCNANGLPSADAFNYDADFNTDQRSCILSCLADPRCFSTGFYIVTNPNDGSQTGTCRKYSQSVTDSADLGAGFYTFNDKACPPTLNSTRFRGNARKPRPYSLEF